MAVEVHESCGSLSEADVRSLEKELGFSLPAEYKDFLLNHNGGWPEPNEFPIEDNPSDDRGRVHYFLCIEDGDEYNLMDWVVDYEGRLPPGLLPIACDPGGNLICLSVSGENAGTVYFWDHEEEAGPGETPSYENAYHVAESFGEFLERLTGPEKAAPVGN